MATIEEKFGLAIEAANLLLQQEFRGPVLLSHRPKVSLVVEKDPEEQGGIDISTNFRLVYPDGSVGDPVNWSGIGRSVDESLTSNLWGLQFEIEERLTVYTAMLARLKLAAPSDT